MIDLLHLGLRVGGGSLVILAIASFWIPKVLGWREKLMGLTSLPTPHAAHCSDEQ